MYFPDLSLGTLQTQSAKLVHVRWSLHAGRVGTLFMTIMHNILSNMQEVVRTHHWPWGTCPLPCCRQDTHEGSNDSGHHSRWLSQGNSNPIPGTCFPREMCSSKCSQQGMYASCHKPAKRLQPIKVSLEHLKLTVRSWSKPLRVLKNWSCKKHYTWPGRSQRNEDQGGLQTHLTDNKEEYQPLQGVLGMAE